MNANAFCQIYEYHFSENRKLWDSYITSLSPEQFIQNADYSRGSIRNQIVHLMSADNDWFSELKGQIPKSLNPPDTNDRNLIRAHWDNLEQEMREYLSKITDDRLFEKPFPEGEDKDLILWQVLLHVVNHGTDHRAQILRLLNDLGFKTGPQDYIFYLYDHL